MTAPLLFALLLLAGLFVLDRVRKSRSGSATLPSSPHGGGSGPIAFAVRVHEGGPAGAGALHAEAVAPAGAFFLASGFNVRARPGLAARRVADGLRSALDDAAARRPEELAPARAAAFLRAQIEAANARVAAINAERARGAPEGSEDRAGVTVVAVLFAGDRLFVAHVGADRAYLVRAGEAEQITEDHSLISDFIREKGLSRAEAEDARATLPQRFRDVIVRGLGMKDSVAVDVGERALARGDRVVLVTKGVGDCLGDAALEALLAQGGDGDGEALAERVMERVVRAEAHREHAVVVVTWG